MASVCNGDGRETFNNTFDVKRHPITQTNHFLFEIFRDNLHQIFKLKIFFYGNERCIPVQIDMKLPLECIF
ncbi:hypothetical protein YC2023_099024 [Brassica napus]